MTSSGGGFARPLPPPRYASPAPVNLSSGKDPNQEFNPHHHPHHHHHHQQQAAAAVAQAQAQAQAQRVLGFGRGAQGLLPPAGHYYPPPALLPSARPPYAPRPPSPRFKAASGSSTSASGSGSASFRRGSLIRLASGRLKRVEELRTEDFVSSAEASPHHRLHPATVVRIQQSPNTGSGSTSDTRLLTLSYGPDRRQVEVESPAEHPYFVYGQGWASCSPQSTLSVFGLSVHRLQVGDVCISLTPRRGAGVEGGSTGRKRRWSAPEPSPG